MRVALPALLREVRGGLKPFRGGKHLGYSLKMSSSRLDIAWTITPGAELAGTK